MRAMPIILCLLAFQTVAGLQLSQARRGQRRNHSRTFAFHNHDLQQRILPTQYNVYEWLLPSSTSPPPRAYHVAVATGASMIVHGGVSIAQNGTFSAPTTVYSDVWVYSLSLSAWSLQPRPTTTIPSGRAGHSALYLDKMFIFGGYTLVNGKSELCSDVLWEYDINANTWIPGTTDNAPTPRIGAAMATDNNRENLYLFGGVSSEGQLENNNVYSYSTLSRVWNKVITSGPNPEARAFAFGHVVDDRWIIAGGSNVKNMTFNTSYELDFATATWTAHDKSASPALSAGASYVFQSNSTLHTLGGTAFAESVSLSYCLEKGLFASSEMAAWEFTGDIWTQSWHPSFSDQYEEVPAARHGHTVVGIGSHALLYGGISTYSFTLFGDLWSIRGVYDGELWVNPVDINDSPIPKSGATWTVLNDAIYLFGGWASSEELDDVWKYHPDTNVWSILDFHDRITPSRRAYHVAFAQGSRMYLHGGCDIHPNGTFIYRDDLWYYNESNRFVEVNVSGSRPGGRAGHSVAQISSDVYLFGGKNSEIALNDLWSYHPRNNSWYLLPTGTTKPSGRWGHRIFPCHSRLFLFGGRDFDTVYDELWEYAIGKASWMKVEVAGSRPAPLTFFSIEYASDKALLFGGVHNIEPNDNHFVLTRSDNYNYTRDTWELYISSSDDDIYWNLVQMDVDMYARAGHTSALRQSGGDSLMYIWGGFTFDSYLNDLHVVRLGCNKGSYSEGSFMDHPCIACPVGKFSGQTGARNCSGTCSGQTTTKFNGSTSAADCKFCEPNACHGHGHCSVGALGGKVTCSCSLVYRGSEMCDKPVDLIVLLVAVAATAVVAIAVQCSLTRVGKFKRQTATAYTLLDESQAEVAQLSEAWHIHQEDLTLLRRIDKDCEGTWGEVYLGEWLGHKVAVKKLRNAAVQLSAFSDSVTTNFEREIAMLRELRHRNIVLFFGAGDLDGAPFLVTEFCKRGSLATILSNKEIPLPWKKKRGFALDAACGMQFIHNQNPMRLHRDLKSANLLVTEDWTVKVSDFGTAKLVACGQQLVENVPVNDDATIASNMTQHVGTVPYMSPEILRMMSYGPEADVYSFAITLWEICTRSEPFKEKQTSWDIMKAAKAGERPRLSPETPTGLNTLIVHCWDPNPLTRPSFDHIVRTLREMKLK